MGAWIEIGDSVATLFGKIVAPFVGAWIEIYDYTAQKAGTARSLPSWERGLKYPQDATVQSAYPRRSLRGSVD